MPCMKIMYRDTKASVHWSAARNEERSSSRGSTAGRKQICSPIGLHRISLVRASEETFRTVVVIGHNTAQPGTRDRTQSNVFESTGCVRSDAHDAQQVRRAGSTLGKSARTRRVRRRAERADARSTHAHRTRRHAERASARRSRPSGPAFLFSLGRARRSRGSGPPNLRARRRSPRAQGVPRAPKDSRQANWSHSRGALKVSGAPGCVA